MKRSLALLLLLAAPILHAQTLTGTLTANPASGNAPFATTLTWAVTNPPAGTTCTASGSWTGSKPVSGSQAISGLLSPASYGLSCTWPGKAATALIPDTANLTWTPPTQNTDGSSLTNLAGFRIYHGTVATALNQTIQVASPGASAFAVDISVAGPHYFAVTAYVTTGAESINSNVASKTMSPTAPQPAVPPSTWSTTLPVAVNPQPKPPLLTIDSTAYKQDSGNKDQAKVRVVGTVPLQTPCITTLSPFSGQPVDYLGLNLVPQSKLTLTSGVRCTSTAVAGCPLQVWAKCAVPLAGLTTFDVE